jgi:RNA polymerase sigma-70 factor (ECF subfamily)
VVNHSAQSRSVQLSADDRDDLCADVFLAIIRDDFAVLRRFRGQSSLATYLTVVARRVVIKRLLEEKSPTRLSELAAAPEQNGDPRQRLVDDREEVARLMEHLNPEEQVLVRLHHLEGKSYQQIAAALGVSENSVGPMLSRARAKMRNAEGAHPAS